MRNIPAKDEGFKPFFSSKKGSSDNKQITNVIIISRLSNCLIVINPTITIKLKEKTVLKKLEGRREIRLGVYIQMRRGTL